jgi:hypothetical protein
MKRRLHNTAVHCSPNGAVQKKRKTPTKNTNEEHQRRTTTKNNNEKEQRRRTTKKNNEEHTKTMARTLAVHHHHPPPPPPQSFSVVSIGLS